MKSDGRNAIQHVIYGTPKIPVFLPPSTSQPVTARFPFRRRSSVFGFASRLHLFLSLSLLSLTTFQLHHLCFILSSNISSSNLTNNILRLPCFHPSVSPFSPSAPLSPERLSCISSGSTLDVGYCHWRFFSDDFFFFFFLLQFFRLSRSVSV